jgi:hypothetical protein
MEEGFGFAVRLEKVERWLDETVEEKGKVDQHSKS